MAKEGSSLMPHKRNLIGSEGISGLSRVQFGYVASALKLVTLMLEMNKNYKHHAIGMSANILSPHIKPL